jgi:hypothetical protein
MDEPKRVRILLAFLSNSFRINQPSLENPYGVFVLLLIVIAEYI